MLTSMEMVPSTAPLNAAATNTATIARTKPRIATVHKSIAPPPRPTPPRIGIAPEDDGGLSALYELAEQENNAAVAPDGPHCPSCRSALAEGAVLCTDCGYDTRSGKSLATTKEAPVLGYATPNANGSNDGPKKKKRSFGEIVIAQWPGALGLLFIAAGLGVVWQAYAFPPHVLYIKLVAVLIACGMAALGYWAFANNDSDYTF
jgi:hypothetical protein